MHDPTVERFHASPNQVYLPYQRTDRPPKSLTFGMNAYSGNSGG